MRIQSVSAQLALSGTIKTAGELRPGYMDMVRTVFDGYATQLGSRPV